jgi:biotin carboxylase
MSSDQTLIFFGKHTSDWTKILLSSELLTQLSKYITNAQQIDNPNQIPPCKYIIPLMENHMIILHQSKIKAIMPKLSDITTFRNKFLFHKYASEFKLDNYVPRLYPSADVIDRPVIIKPVIGYASTNMTLVEGDFSSIPSEKFNTNKYIVEEFFPDKNEYVTHIVAINGKIIHHLTYCYTYSVLKNIKFRDYFKVILFSLEPHYLAILELFLMPCSYSGVCNFNFRIINDEVKVFEINPRLGGSLIKEECLNELAKMISVLLENSDKI